MTIITLYLGKIFTFFCLFFYHYTAYSIGGSKSLFLLERFFFSYYFGKIAYINYFEIFSTNRVNIFISMFFIKSLKLCSL